MKRISDYILSFFMIIGIMAAVCLPAYYFGKRERNKTIEVRRDTVTVHDTLRLTEVNEIQRIVTDTIWVRLLASEKSTSEGSADHFVEVSKTMAASETDSLLVGLPYEQVTYSDSTFTAIVGGYRPELKSIEIYNKTITITNTQNLPAPRWSLNATLGPAIVYNETGFHGGFGLAVGISYRF